MGDAMRPELIWVNFKEANRLDVAYDEPPATDYADCRDEYIRADLHAARIAELEAERDRFEAALARACQVGGTTYLVERAQKAEAERDALEEAIAELEGLKGCCDEAWDNLQLASDALSELA